jgi:hypothetical protein
VRPPRPWSAIRGNNWGPDLTWLTYRGRAGSRPTELRLCCSSGRDLRVNWGFVGCCGGLRAHRQDRLGGDRGPSRFSTEETLDFGEDTGTPVDMSYDVPCTFTGVLGKIVIELK